MADKDLAPVLAERFNGFEARVMDKLESIHQQVIKTNGRVTSCEGWMHEHDIDEAKLLPKYDAIITKTYWILGAYGIAFLFILWVTSPQVFSFIKSVL